MFAEDIMEIDAIAKVAGPLLSLLVGAIIKHIATARSKLSWYWGNSSKHTLRISNSDGSQLQQDVHTHSVVILNSGRRAAHDVRMSHTILPINISVYPAVKYEIQQNSDGSGDIVFPCLVPKEQVMISYLYYPPLVWNQINYSVKSLDGFANQLNIIPAGRPALAIRLVGYALMFVGASFLSYLAIKALLLLVS